MLVFQPVSQTSRLSERVFIQIRDAIAAGRYQSGDKLPSENELAGAFKVSRTSVREAIKMLAGQGLVTVKRGLGAYVEHRNPSYLANLQNILSREKDNILELFQIRKILEMEAAAWAAEKARPEDIKKMERLLDEAKVLVRDPKQSRQRLGKINTEFHSTLIKAAGNRTLLKVMSGIMDMLTGGRDITLQLPGRNAGSVAGHREILDALKEKNSAKARQSMAKHLDAVMETIIKNAQ